MILLFLIFIYAFIVSMLLLTINSRNPITAILFLILFFFGLSVLFLFSGADYMGVLFLLLYAGAISIIFLFVVMFLDLKEVIAKKETYSYLTFFILSAFVFINFYELVKKFFDKTNLSNFRENLYFSDWTKIFGSRGNIEALGLTLYEDYLFQFLALGLVLFLIMVLVITLLINFNLLSKKQALSEQLTRRPQIKQVK